MSPRADVAVMMRDVSLLDCTEWTWPLPLFAGTSECQGTSIQSPRLGPEQPTFPRTDGPRGLGVTEQRCQRVGDGATCEAGLVIALNRIGTL